MPLIRMLIGSWLRGLSSGTGRMLARRSLLRRRASSAGGERAGFRVGLFAGLLDSPAFALDHLPGAPQFLVGGCATRVGSRRPFRIPGALRPAGPDFGSQPLLHVKLGGLKAHLLLRHLVEDVAGVFGERLLERGQGRVPFFFLFVDAALGKMPCRLSCFGPPAAPPGRPAGRPGRSPLNG